jgi:tetratricopeptide (TPR) repeat protein
MPEYLAGKNAYQLMVNTLIEKNKSLTKGDNGGKFFEMYLEVNKILTKKLHQAGVLLLLGTDTPAITVAVVPGYSIHEELRILTECGLTPFEALKTGTANAGIAEKAMTGTNNIGTIEVGKQADFILTAKNPLENVANIREMAGVMLQGKWLARTELEALKVTVRENLADALAEVIRNNGGVEAIVKKYNEIKRAASNEHYILPDPLNNLGYNLLGENKIAEAITVFKINVQEFPDYWGWYDSLAEAYMKAGDKELAIENYEKSLRLNPNNKAAIAALRILKKQEK